MTKVYIGAIRLTNEYLSDKLGKPVSDFSLKNIRKGTGLHSSFYELNVKSGEEQFTVFVKDSIEGGNTSISGHHYVHGKKVTENEIRFLGFGRQYNAFTPRIYDGDIYMDKEKQSHIVIFMEHFGKSLEEKLLELDKLDKKSADLAFDYGRRTIDRILRNFSLVLKYQFETKDTIGNSTVIKTTRENLEPEIKQALYGLLMYVHGEGSDKLTREQYLRVTDWCVEKNLSRMVKALYELVVEPLVRDQDEHVLLNLDLHPGNVLVNDAPLQEYDPNLVLGNEADHNIVITDNCKIGMGPLAIVSFLTTHPSFYNLLSPERVQQLADHTLVQYETIRQEKRIGLEDILPTKREKFYREWAAATRLACLRRLSFVSWLNVQHPEKAKSFAEHIPLYAPKTFINSVIDYFGSLKDVLTPLLKETQQGLESLKINGSK